MLTASDADDNVVHGNAEMSRHFAVRSAMSVLKAAAGLDDAGLTDEERATLRMIAEMQPACRRRSIDAAA